jgi:hypothetical protein
MIQIAATAVKVLADAPLLAPGDIEANPNPDPMASKTKLVAITTAVPAKIAGHDTADFEASTVRSELAM